MCWMSSVPILRMMRRVSRPPEGIVLKSCFSSDSWVSHNSPTTSDFEILEVFPGTLHAKLEAHTVKQASS